MQLAKRNRQKLILESKNIYTGMLVLALPIFLSNFMKAINDFIDMYFISNFIDENVKESMTALQITGPVFMICLALAGGLMVAGSAIIAQYYGAKQFEKARLVAGQLFKLCLIFGLVVNVAMLLFSRQIMILIGAEGEALNFMVEYLTIRSFEMAPMFIYFAFHASRQASGDTFTPFLMNAIMIVFNIVATWFFVGTLRMGIRGAAIGTLLAHIIIVPIFMILMFKPNSERISINFTHLRTDFDEIKKLFQLGWPAAFSQAFTSLGFIIINALILGLGYSTVNAFGVGNRINMLVLMPAMGVGGVVATFVGQNIGARNQVRARQSVKAAMILAILMSGIGALIVLPFSNFFGSLFLKEDPDALVITVEYLFFLLTGLPFMGIFQVFMGAYQGNGESRYSLIISTIRLWVMRIPMVLFFTNQLNLGASSLWYAMVISNIASCFLGTMLYTLCKFIPKVKLPPLHKHKLEEKLT